MKIEKRWDRGSNRNKSTHFSTPISGTDLPLVEIVWSAVWGLGIFVLLATNLYSNWLISASPMIGTVTYFFVDRRRFSG